MNLKNIKVLKSIAALSLAAMMSLSGVCASADTTELGEGTAKLTTPFFYKQPAPGFSTYYYDDFESWTVDKNVVEGEIEQSLGTGEAKNDGSTRNLWNTWSQLDRQKITEIDGDKCLTLLPAGDGNNAASIRCIPGENAYSTYSRRWNNIECKFRLLNSETAGSIKPAAIIELEKGNLGKLIKIDDNSITIFPDTKTDSDNDRTYNEAEGTSGKWYTLKIEFAFPRSSDPNWSEKYYNKYKITVSDDKGNTLLNKSGDDFKSVAYGTEGLLDTRPLRFKCSGASGTEFNLSKIKIQTIQTYKNDWETKIIDPVREISKPSVTEEGEKVTTSYDFTNLTFGDKTRVDPLKGAVLSVNSVNGKNDCMSESFVPHNPGDAADSSRHEFINKKIEFGFNKDDKPSTIKAANVGVVRGRLSATVEGKTANVNTYLLDSLDGLRLHGMTNQKSASITKAQENDNGTVTINGTADNYAKDDKVLLYIIKNGTTLSNIDTDNSKKSDLVYVKEVTPNSSTGAFTAELTPDFAGGAYNVGIGGSHKADTETPLNVSGISLNVKSGDKDINKLTDIEDGTADVSVTAAFGNKDELDKSMMCVATYKDGVLTGIKMGVVDSTTKTLSTTFKKGGSDRAAIFIWNKTTYAPYKFKDIK